MDGAAVERRLRDEGFARVFTWSDAPCAVYPSHTHATTSAHVVLAGGIEITSVSVGTRTFGPGERFDVPAGEVHSARVGPQGCTYVVGE